MKAAGFLFLPTGAILHELRTRDPGAWRAIVLWALEEAGATVDAAEMLGVGSSTVRAWRVEDPVLGEVPVRRGNPLFLGPENPAKRRRKRKA